jgi:hypothetical protein
MIVTAHRHLGGALAQISLRGPARPSSPAALRRVLESAVSAGATMVIVDLHPMESFDPALGQTLLDFDQRLELSGGWLRLVHGADPAGSVLRLTGMHDRIGSSPSREAAGWLDSDVSSESRSGPMSKS